MDIIQICSFALAALFVYIILDKTGSKISFMTGVLAGTAIFIFMIPHLSEVIWFIKDLANASGIDAVYIEIVMKIIAISYIASFCMEICKDAGSSILASKIEFAAKILILVLAIPILVAVLNSILKIM